MKFIDLLSALVTAGNGSHGEMARVVRSQIARAVGAATATAGAATLSALQGRITSESLTTAQNGIYALTLTNDQIAAGDIVLASVANGTNTQGTPIIGRVQPAAGSAVIQVINQHASSQALNGTLVISFVVVKAA
jgi:SOS-response transcriptional repressor LexA